MSGAGNFAIELKQVAIRKGYTTSKRARWTIFYGAVFYAVLFYKTKNIITLHVFFQCIIRGYSMRAWHGIFKHMLNHAILWQEFYRMVFDSIVLIGWRCILWHDIRRRTSDPTVHRPVHRTLSLFSQPSSQPEVIKIREKMNENKLDDKILFRRFLFRF